ncbi:Holliday junction branch migration protein RuvA [Legionella impletisoli]|uniref:Holliday junction branch migration complex subunit RuvA n=1 Tax=Legionella impletisoli TaxID=343510 RepID=A0A917JPV9_9GAMM|nr:Holliday junction branch migration protein RuvA [Legionella impletisoli]GGI80627.1 Holliday junction ATP-dependent DNA helicase RuvA [Legionella impletisoli]
MIGWLKGRIIDKNQPGKLVVDVNGVGYDVETSLQTFFQLTSLDSLVGLHIHTVVREDALLLYGFLDEEERALFRALIKVNGVGPKLAIAILSSITPAEFVQCIQNQDPQMLTRLPGIGKKTAERLVVEMKDNLNGFSAISKTSSPLSVFLPAEDEAIKALESLGYKSQEAIKAVKKVDDGRQTSEQLIRQALQVLSR